MQKPLRAIAAHLRNIILPPIPGDSAVKPAYAGMYGEEKLRNGVNALGDFLRGFCDYLSVEGDKYDKPKKIAHPFSDRVSIVSNYPFLHLAQSVLVTLGLRGSLSDSGDMLAIAGAEFRSELGAFPLVRISECLQSFEELGLASSGASLTDSDVIEFAYPANPALFIGIKLMARASEEFEGTGLRGIMLRCDYRMLLLESDNLAFLKSMTNPLPAANRDFIVNLHRKNIESGLECRVNIVDDTCIRFFYSCRQRDILAVIISANNGYELAIRAAHTDEYPEVIEGFHPYLREKISRGYGCDKKRTPGAPCQGGCKGYRVSLAEPVEYIERDIGDWIAAELYFFLKEKVSKRT